jgi:poly-gamma-glutamate synthesis protein (capsule biosynthesis protein)
MQDTKNLIKSIQEAKNNADIVVVTMHAGVEYTREPTPLQTDFAHTAIDNGADIVIGAHPHWIQGIEQYGGKYIFYSLGNFVFDQEFSPETKEGMTLKINLRKDKTAHIEQIELMPIIIENYGQPRLANAEEKSRILESM